MNSGNLHRSHNKAIAQSGSKDSPKLQQKRSSVVRFQKIPRTPQYPLFDLFFHSSPPVWPGEGAIARLSILYKAALVETSIGPSHGAVAVHLTGKAMKICHILSHSVTMSHQTQFQHQQANNTSICPGRGAGWFCWLGSSAAQELTWRQIPPKNRFAA